ncbi:MAG: hypothetical protein CVU84_03985 [Firmicutes bacterium HGW-Firmicutes-1]|jgi:hypothetical protein|nr:MAG: hypothetical protein CVU84_03985 [Firmicutes bacterium HGW-Firmicutes-1]
MKLNSKKIFFLVTIMTFSVTTIGFAILSIANKDNWLFRIGTQVSLIVSLLMNGLQTLTIQKKEGIAFFLIC